MSLKNATRQRQAQLGKHMHSLRQREEMEAATKRVVLITPQRSGYISQAQADEYKDHIFHCGLCSTETEDVYHNTLGQHLHRHPTMRPEE